MPPQMLGYLFFAGLAAAVWLWQRSGSTVAPIPTPLPIPLGGSPTSPAAAFSSRDAFAALQVVNARLLSAGIPPADVRKLVEPIAPLLLREPPEVPE